MSGSDREAQLEQVIQVLRVQLDTAIAQVQALIEARDKQISPVLASPAVTAPADVSALTAPDAHLTLLNGWYQEMRVLGRGLSGEVHRLLGATESYLGMPR